MKPRNYQKTQPARSGWLHGLLLAGVMAALPVLGAAPTGLWNFDQGDLRATVGQPLTFVAGDGGATETGTTFVTTTSVGLPDIGGSPAMVMGFPATIPGGGYSMPTPANPNGEGGYVNQWTLVMDILFPADSMNKLRALLETDLGTYDPNADFFVGANNGLGAAGKYDGALQANTWHRIALVVDAGVGRPNAISKYIDGVFVGTEAAGTVDGRWALTPGASALLFADDTGETAAGYVNSIQLREEALSRGQVGALGGPSADGIPVELPPVPSFLDRWIPTGPFASRTTDIGAVINDGDTTIADSSISITVDGTALTGLTITRDGDLIRVVKPAQGPYALGSEHTVVLSYMDSLAGAKTFTQTFTAAVFFENFEGLVLEDSVQEAAGSAGVWTKTPPTGWTIDDTGVPGAGNPDLDGVTEWAGWSFANREWWAQVAGDQDRSLFTSATGTVAIADPDEWDDASHDFGMFNSFMKTPSIPIAGIPANSMFIKLASSWRPECCDDSGELDNSQTATITVSYDGGPEIEILKYDSTAGSPTFKADAQNEIVIRQLNNPEGAQNMVLNFGLTRAENDWWWAVDDILVQGGAEPPVITQQPLSLYVTAGAPVTLSVTSTGTQPLAYQWRFNDAPINGATAATLTLPAASAADVGLYTVVVSNPGGSVTSTAASLAVLSPATIGQDLVTHLKFDNDLNDASGRGNHGTAIGAPTFSTGKVGANAAHIPSGADYVSLGAPTDLNFGVDTDFSISFWTKVTALSGDPSLIGNKDWDSGSNPGYVLFTEGDYPFRWNLAGKTDGTNGDRKDYAGPDGTFADHAWHHIAVTFDRQGLASMYVDGAQIGSRSLASPPNNLDTPVGFATNIGQDGAGDYGSVFTDMDMDDLGIWRRVLSVQEIANIYAQGQAGQDLSTATYVPPASAKVYPFSQWDFNEGDLRSTVGNDLAYRGNTASGTTFETVQIGGQDAKVMKFPATTADQGFILTHGALDNGGGQYLNQYTLIMDVMFPAASTDKWRCLFQTSPSNANDGDFFVNTGNGIGISGAYHGTILADTWHRIAFAVDLTGPTVGKYIDGQLVNTQTLGAGVDGRWSLDATALLLADEDGETAAGYMNSVQFHGRTLSAEEIAALGSPTASGIPLPTLTGQWDFDQGDLRATVGFPMEFRGDTANTTTFETVPIGGQDAKVMKFPACTPEQGFMMSHGAMPNAGGQYVNQYTIIMDVMFPADSTGKWRGLFQTSTANANDGDFFVNTGNGIGISGGYHGTILADTWHRVAFAVDLTGPTVGKFIDGVLVNLQTLGAGVDGRWSLDPAALLFTDEDGETASGYVNSVQFHSRTLSEAEIAALGTPTAAGIPTVGAAPLHIASVNVTSTTVTIAWTGGQGPFQLQKRATLNDAWADIGAPVSGQSTTDTVSGDTAFYRIVGR